jgi:hypothetical protein
MNDINVWCLRFFAAVAPGGCNGGASERAVVQGLRVTGSSAGIAAAHDGDTARPAGEMFETGMPTSIGGIHNGEHRQPATE